MVGAARTAVGTFGGILKDVPNVQLAKTVVKTAIERSGLPASAVEHVVMGDEGPYHDKKAYDLLIQSEAALLSVTGTPEDDRMRHPRMPSLQPSPTGRGNTGFCRSDS